jgi:hypothetical protein
MKKNTVQHHLGIWIDSKNAVIISTTDSGEKIKKIVSGIDTRLREEGETNQLSKMGGQYLEPEKSKLSKKTEQQNLFFRSIMEEINNADSFVLFGPSSMKYNLGKEIQKNRKLSGKMDGVETADSMTENQLVAWIKDFYKASAN